ncbi:hypothetical protein Msil_1701 [Methylocella silvestris BL2]|uniref:Lipoprotein n=1 Tax=Methylocella silvestris (strain DSM 15510 / CIP 108128 / LMG 27833 / NCIMB 13906 / BL2) TaxID=395965 RepID=B8EKA8_METSB|nr:hypothetical protein Msil_1701 [Methylocella silvestris BL2]
MRFFGKLILPAIAVACAYGLATKCASAQAAGPNNGLDHTMRSLEDLRDDVRARAGWRKDEWVCQQPSGPCVWHAGYWGPAPAPIPPPRTVYITIESVRGFPWIGEAPPGPPPY